MDYRYKLQNLESCIETAIEVNPDRIVTFSCTCTSVILDKKYLKNSTTDSNQKAQMYDTSLGF